MSTTHELLARATSVYGKYEKYVVKRPGEGEDADGRRADGAYGAAYSALLDRINGLMQKADEVRATTDRAAKAALNADVRRAKAVILEVDLPALHKLLAKRGIVKALAPEQLAARKAQLAAARDLVVAVPDGVHTVPGGGASVAGRAGLLGSSDKARKKGGASAAISLVVAAGRGGTGASTSSSSTSTTPPGGRVDADGYWAESEAATAFRAEFEASKARQDKVMDGIERGLGDLKEIGAAMGRALDEQYVLTAAIDDKVGDVNKNIKQSNTRVKSLLTEMRPARNFCVDATLLCVLLAIGLSIYNAVMQQRAKQAAAG